MDEAMLKRVVGEALDDKLGSFIIEREQHYQDHMFVNSVRNGAEKIKGTACKAVTTSIISAGILMLLWGLVHLGESVFNLRATK